MKYLYGAIAAVSKTVHVTTAALFMHEHRGPNQNGWFTACKL